MILNVDVDKIPGFISYFNQKIHHGGKETVKERKGSFVVNLHDDFKHRYLIKSRILLHYFLRIYYMEEKTLSKKERVILFLNNMMIFSTIV